MKKAFTLLELIFVIVVIGILAAVIVPNTHRSPLREAAVQLISHIRYTQHLAMVDDKYNYFNSNAAENSTTHWYRSRWQLVFTDTRRRYSIYSDGLSGGAYDGNANEFEMAVDPNNKAKVLSSGSNGFLSTNAKANKKLNLKDSYGISSVTMNGGCNGDTRISFDHFGRPISGTISTTTTPYSSNKLLVSTCNMVLNSSEGNVTIAIEPETGYVHIL